ncbi:uncharacterized protein LOC144921856 [Branchiostoma floridae x Branchiostoma belcheri]
MKHLAVLLCLSGLAAVCLGQTNTTDVTTDATTADATTVSLPGGPTSTGSGTAASPGGTAAGGVTTDAGTGATTASTVQCLSCTGDETSACGTATGTIPTVTCDACWVYRDENTTSGDVTIIRGCALESHTCTSDNESEQCDTATNSDISRCRRCCTTDDCNGSGLTLTGNSGAADVTASVVVTMATALFAIVALWQ